MTFLISWGRTTDQPENLPSSLSISCGEQPKLSPSRR